jgi:hypothetical protein
MNELDLLKQEFDTKQFWEYYDLLQLLEKVDCTPKTIKRSIFVKKIDNILEKLEKLNNHK